MTVLTVSDIVISGIGVISAAGVGGAALIRALKSGGAAPAPADMRDFDADDFIDPNRSRRMDPLSKMAVAAAWLAVRDAGFEVGAPGTPDPRLGVAFGTSFGCQATELRYAEKLVAQGARFTNPIDFPDSIDGAPAAHVALELGVGGPSSTHADGTLSGEHALLHAVFDLQSGRADRVLVGAGDALTPLLEEVSRTFQCTPSRAPRGQGVAFLALEREGDARARGARPHGRLLALSQRIAPGCRPHRRAAPADVPCATLERALAQAGSSAQDLEHCLLLAGPEFGLDAATIVILGPGGTPVHLSPEVATGEIAAGGLVRLASACLLAEVKAADEAEPSMERFVALHATSRGGESFAVVVGGVRPRAQTEDPSSACVSS